MKNMPKHVAIILDGNGRWATEKNLPRSSGHKAGFDNLKKLSLYIFNKKIEVLSVYAFSTENFNRSKEEVDYLMNLFIKGFNSLGKEFNKKNIKIVFSGRKEPLSDKVYNIIQKIATLTKDNTGGTLNICLNYGGHAEIIDSTKKIIKDIENKKISIEDIDENLYNTYLYQNLPPIDFLIRTSGEERISNFMLWQLSYAEFYFPETYFPDFDEKEFDKAIDIYLNRSRRFGGIKNEKKSN